MYERLGRKCMKTMYERLLQKMYERLDRKCMKDQIKMYERLDRKCMKDQKEDV